MRQTLPFWKTPLVMAALLVQGPQFDVYCRTSRRTLSSFSCVPCSVLRTVRSKSK